MRRCFPRNEKKKLLLILYGGGISALINIGLYVLLINSGIDYKISNIITLILVKGFTYITNKKFVFRSVCDNTKKLIKEIVIFSVARVSTFLIDLLGIIILVEIVGCEQLFSKIIMDIIIVILNYVFSKLIVFKRR